MDGFCIGISMVDASLGLICSNDARPSYTYILVDKCVSLSVVTP